MEKETRTVVERLYHQAKANAMRFEEVARDYDRVGMPASADSAREQAAGEYAQAARHEQTLKTA